MKKFLFVIAALVVLGGCTRATPPVQTATSYASSPRCDAMATDKERADCNAERARLLEKLLESGTEPESRTATPTPPPRPAQPTLLPPTVAPPQYVPALFTTPVAGNAQNGCGSSYDLVVENNSDYMVEVQAGEAFMPCGNGATLVAVMVMSAPGTQPRMAYMTPPGMRSTWTFDPLRGGHGKQTLLATAYPRPALGPDGRFLPVPVMAAKRRPPVETELPYGARGRRFPIANGNFGI